MTRETDHGMGAAVAARIERRWATLSIVIVGSWSAWPPSPASIRRPCHKRRVETADPEHAASFGANSSRAISAARVEADGSVTVRAIGQQYSFTPQCMLVPAETPITFRATSADVVHGFLIEGTNVNTMLVPGYVSELPIRFEAPGEHLMPCQEFCGIGHEGMWGKVKVIDKAEFLKHGGATKRRLSCVD